MGKHDMKVWFDEKQETMPLQRLEHPANVSARAYLEFYALSWQEVARAARLPLASVWRIVHDLPVSQAQAAGLRAGLYRLTGIAYTGPISTYPDARHHETRPGPRIGGGA